VIRFRDVTKTYRAGFLRKVGLDNANSDIIPRRSLDSLGINDAGKSTLIRLQSGASMPDRGLIDRGKLRKSWSPDFRGFFATSTTGREILRFACRIYGEACDRMTLYVGEFSNFGAYVDMSVSSYSSGSQARLAFAYQLQSRLTSTWSTRLQPLEMPNSRSTAKRLLLNGLKHRISK